MSQFYEKEGVLVQDNDVPFVKTISDVVRFEDGKMVEHKLTSEMPDYLGAGSELIIHATVPKYANGVLEGDKITDGATEIGYLLGGIRSSDRNIFFTNTGSQSEASATLFKVHIKKIKLKAPISIYVETTASVRDMKQTTGIDVTITVSTLKHTIYLS